MSILKDLDPDYAKSQAAKPRRHLGWQAFVLAVGFTIVAATLWISTRHKEKSQPPVENLASESEIAKETTASQSPSNAGNPSVAQAEPASLPQAALILEAPPKEKAPTTNTTDEKPITEPKKHSATAQKTPHIAQSGTKSAASNKIQKENKASKKKNNSIETTGKNKKELAKNGKSSGDSDVAIIRALVQ
ncbi:MAG: hypothetical protein LWW83_06480 [Azonexaceae bacterium]|nr:hypothetical protein [Azonexaceae bacterium]